MIAEIGVAASLGLVTAISPCPLATNVAAISFLGRHAGSPGRSIRSSIAYLLGRTACYTALASLLTAGLMAATMASATLGRYAALLVGPLLVVAGGMLIGLIPAPSFGNVGEGVRDALVKRGDALGSFLLGVVFALSFCPTSAALFFGSLVPLASKAESTFLVPATYGLATGLPVLVFAVLVAAGSNKIGRAFDRIQAIDRWLRLVTGILIIGAGVYLSLDINLNLLD